MVYASHGKLEPGDIPALLETREPASHGPDDAAAGAVPEQGLVRGRGRQADAGGLGAWRRPLGGAAMNSITRRKSAAAALCFFLLAICAVVWAASAGTTDAGEGPETALPLGNSFVRLSSGRAEAVCGGETAYSRAPPRRSSRWGHGRSRLDSGRTGLVPRRGRATGGGGARAGPRRLRRGLPRGRGHIRDGGGRVRGRIQPGGRSLRPGVRGLLPHRAAFEPGAGRIAPACAPRPAGIG